MILYHYTSMEALWAIARHGLTRGDVPTSPTTGFNAVWLTDDPNGAGHGLAPKKRVLRFEVDLPLDDPNLVKWSNWAQANGVERKWYQTLDRAGGWKAKSWWLYLKAIPATSLTPTVCASTGSLSAGMAFTDWPDGYSSHPSPTGALAPLAFEEPWINPLARALTKA